ncbi:MAG: ABC transporter ATP-binding protein [Candidatus Omnitrophica bacterium]|nr:ABC transporter ATP-binding protein [Candidatus Omnitrophota bacterium]
MLEAKNIRKGYKNGVKELHVLKGIDIKVEEGEFISVFGPSGAGKSTLLHILGGLDRPTDGTVFLDGKDIYKLSEKEKAWTRNTKIGFVFQFYHLLPDFTVLENVMMPLCIGKKGVGEEGQKKSRAKDILDLVALTDRLDHKPPQLSGGEKQRVAIARAVVNRPRLLLCDEPTGNLDSESGKQIIELLDELNKKNRTTVIVVTHEEKIAQRADRVFRIKDGKIY